MLIVYIILAIILVPVLILVILILYEKLRERLRSGDSYSFNKLEEVLVNKLILELEKEAGDRLANQLPYLPKKSRYYFDKSLSLELYGQRQTHRPPDEFLLPVRRSFKLAKINFSIKDKKFSAEFGCYDGRLFDITIRPNPRKYKRRADVIFTKFKLLNDPLREPDLTFEKKSLKNVDFTGYLKTWNQKYILSELFIPIEKNRIPVFENFYGIKLPTEYKELILQTEGLTTDELQIFGISKMSEVSMEDGNYFILAEFNGELDLGAVAIKQSKSAKSIYFFNYETNESKRLGTSFKAAIEKLLNQQKRNN
ncbi:hypothetical protein QQ008_28965 [Fulvivirgaceae bacterium BMA10]|uniref:DUF4340 domain-containing protein n=1 Tax=Splendidivirga corallicola TaxID=3051826 RepID=A0ABT8KXE9_9BACT|nr:hypothetical protein [Fulvivirgaceae bacterium BMA10]